MTKPARFTFDLDLAERPRSGMAVAGMSEELVAQLIAHARDEGFAEGRKAGEGAADVRAAQALAAAAAALASRTVEMTASIDDARKLAQREAVELAASVGRKLAGHLLARQPAAELEALIIECMASLDRVPHLVIRCHPDIADAIRDTATAHMQTSGFAGRLIVMGDPEQGLGDGRIEWVDGGLVRDMGALASGIDTAISDYLAARGIAPERENVP